MSFTESCSWAASSCTMAMRVGYAVVLRMSGTFSIFSISKPKLTGSIGGGVFMGGNKFMISLSYEKNII